MLLRKIFSLFLLITTVLSCAANVPDTEYYLEESDKGIQFKEPKHILKVFLDDRFTKEQTLSLKTALADWSTQLNDQLYFSVDIANLSEDDKKMQPNTIKVYREVPPKGIGFAAWDFPDHSAIVWMNIDIEPELYYAVALHEFGHAIGLPHYEGPYASIMHPNLSLGRKIACADIAAVHEIWNWEENFKCDLKTPETTLNN